MASSIELAVRLAAVEATQPEVLAAISDLDKVMTLVVGRTHTMLNIRMPFRRKDGTSLLGMISASIFRGNDDDHQLLGTMVEA